MNTRNPLARVCALLGLGALILVALSGFAATNAAALAEDLALRPPQPELPSSFWEQHAFWLIPSSLLGVALLAGAVWWCCRPRPSVQLPIEVQTRQALEDLRRQTEDGRTLSEISRVIKRYVAVAFVLPTEEMTTAEFCRAIGKHEGIGQDLANATGEFLRRCDELKFAPDPAGPTSGVVERALALVQLGEARRSQLRQAAGTNPASQPLKTHG